MGDAVSSAFVQTKNWAESAARGSHMSMSLDLQGEVAAEVAKAKTESWDVGQLRRELKNAKQLKQQAMQHVEQRILEIVQLVTGQLKYYYFDSIPRKLLRPLTFKGSLTAVSMADYVGDLQ